MAKFTYPSTRKLLTVGAQRHFDYRYKVRKFLGPILGVVLLLCSIPVLSGAQTAAQYALGVLYFTFGCVLIVRKWLYAWRAARSAFKGREEGLTIEFESDESGLVITDVNAQSKAKWESFVDFHTAADGVLLYPSSQIFYWIPKNAAFSEGSWDDFTTLVTKHVTKTV